MAVILQATTSNVLAKENVGSLLKISHKLVHEGPIVNKSVLNHFNDWVPNSGPFY